MNIIDIGIAKSNTKKSLLGQGSIQGKPGSLGKDAPTISNINVDENNISLGIFSCNESYLNFVAI